LCWYAQVHNAARWRRLRGDWLRATVGFSSLSSVQQQAHLDTKQRRLDEADVTPVSPVHTFLHDERMLGNDDGEGKPLRYLSLYGGIVTRFL
jgi:hypothetical protein